jgi:hypothetical protein
MFQFFSRRILFGFLREIGVCVCLLVEMEKMVGVERPIIGRIYKSNEIENLL